ncbi:hypothetical protein Lal_00012402 [Lupinus albus]|nr:hypothetical protein Lal_00012402 [Lupinus albus]
MGMCQSFQNVCGLHHNFVGGSYEDFIAQTHWPKGWPQGGEGVSGSHAAHDDGMYFTDDDQEE